MRTAEQSESSPVRGVGGRTMSQRGLREAFMRVVALSDARGIGVDVLGAKGRGLADLAELGLPVPPGFVIGTDSHRRWLADGWTDELNGLVDDAVTALEVATGRTLGGSDPLLLSVRPSAVRPLPGLCGPLLNLGMTTATVAALSKAHDERYALNSFRTFIEAFAINVEAIDRGPFDACLAQALALADVSAHGEVPADLLQYVCQRFLAIHAEAAGQSFPMDARVQLRLAVEAAFESWAGEAAVVHRNRAGANHDQGLAVVVQVMVSGDLGERSGAGLVSSRNPATGAPVPAGSYFSDVHGTAIAGGHHTGALADLATDQPELHAELMAAVATLELHRRDMVQVDFTVEKGRLWILQANVGFRTGQAAVRIVHDLVHHEVIALTKHEGLLRLTAEDVEQVLHPSFDVADRDVIATGLAASPGAAVGKVVFSADEASAAHAAGEKVILVCQETSPEDIHGMSVAAGILTTRGGLASHAAVVARGWGTPAVCGAQGIELGHNSLRAAGVSVSAGDVISLDGSTGEVLLGEMQTSASEPPPEFAKVLRWADDVRAGQLSVRANADTGADAAVARNFGAEGIGLCRTEHMFLGEDRLPIVRQMILALTPAKEKMALTRLRMAQRDDFLEILEAMDGLPVTIRLLDPPLHEFLPDLEQLAVAEAKDELDEEGRELLAAAREWHEQNPMMGTRGVRLGYLKPGLYAMQVTALLEAAEERLAAGGTPIIEVMIPLTVTASELAGARGWVEHVLAEHPISDGGAQVTIGTMIETPRAAIRADELAEHADFFSFGTNDLTQLTFGFSRDDFEARLMSLYLDEGLLAGNPFESIDESGVGELVRLGAERGRGTKPDLKLGVCGEHGGDPASIALFYAAGFDYVSCSPYRVPVARLAAAQAILRASQE
jgi:pyruvate, orthophosphate dikinase